MARFSIVVTRFLWLALQYARDVGHSAHALANEAGQIAQVFAKFGCVAGKVGVKGKVERFIRAGRDVG